MDKERTLWCRVGFNISVTADEYKALSEGGENAYELFSSIIRDPSKSKLDGETYFPEEAQYEECEEILNISFNWRS